MYMREIMSRFDTYMKSKGLNDNKVTVECGLSQGLLGQARKGGSDLGKRTIDKILNIYQDINRVWLITGEGNMLVSPSSSSTSPVREQDFPRDESRTATFVKLIPVAVQGGSLTDYIYSVKESDCELIASPIRDVDFAIQVSGDSMAPEYPNGSFVYVKRINERAFIEWGKVYVLDTCNGSVIKILVPSDREGYVRCLSINPDPKFAPFEVSLEDIRGVYRVLLCMSVK